MDYKFSFYILLTIYSLIFFKKIIENYTELNINSTNIFCEKVSSEIESENYYFYKVSILKGKLLINLESKIGDTDLYISFSKYPTKDISNHDNSSSYLGDDVLWLESESPRPIYIGVYCYNQQIKCTFILNICNKLDINPFNRTNIKLKCESPDTSHKSESIIKILFIEIINIFIRL